MPIKQTGGFHFWVKQALPSIYSDALSYYELLEKVIEFLNSVIEQNNAVTDYVELNVGLQDEKISVLRVDFEAFKNTLTDTYNDFRDEIVNDTLPENLEIVLDEWYNSGKLADIINNDVFDMKADKIVEKFDRMKSYKEYGELVHPTGFPTLPYSLYRGHDQLIKHNYKKLSETLTDVTELYVDFVYGNDVSFTGLTLASPVKTMTKVLEIANSRTTSGVIINILSITSDFRNSHSLTNYVLTKHTIFRALNANNKATVITGYPNVTAQFVWVQENGAWKAPRTNCVAVYDSRYKDYLGYSMKLKTATSALNCGATRGSFFTDGVNVWVNLKDGLDPNNKMEIQIILQTSQKMVFVADNKKVMFENVEFISRSVNADCVKVTGNDSTEFSTHNCMFSEGTLNGLYVYNTNRAWIFDSVAPNNGYDGFNYKADALDGSILVTEYNCHAYDNGWSLYYSCNGSTAHNGIYILRVGTVAYRCHGSLIADVNGCFSVNYDCTAYDSLVPIAEASNGKAGFYFDDRQAVSPGQTFLFNCSGGGFETLAIDSDDLAEITVRNFSGSAIRPDLNFTVLT